jgi:hypothetical protein
MTRFMTCRQLENEPLADYVKRFKGNQDSMAQNMGKDFLKDFVKNTKQYVDEIDIDKQDKMQKGSYVQWTAYMLMKNSDQGKYGSLMTSLTTQFSMGTNQYPKDVMAAVDILTNHRFDRKEPKNNNQRNRNQNNDNTAKGAIFHNADWIAGVDYDENIQQEDDNNKDPDEDIKDDQ